MKRPIADRSIVDRRWGVEHAFIGRPDHLPRLKALGAGISAQSHLYMAGPSLVRYWGRERASLVTPMRMYLDGGIPVSSGTDAPVIPFPPLWTIYHFVTRDTITGGRFGPEQAITRAEALRSSTLAPAWLTFEERARADRSWQAGGSRRPGSGHHDGARSPDQGHQGANDHGGRRGGLRRRAVRANRITRPRALQLDPRHRRCRAQLRVLSRRLRRRAHPVPVCRSGTAQRATREDPSRDGGRVEFPGLGSDGHAGLALPYGLHAGRQLAVRARAVGVLRRPAQPTCGESVGPGRLENSVRRAQPRSRGRQGEGGRRANRHARRRRGRHAGRARDPGARPGRLPGRGEAGFGRRHVGGQVARRRRRHLNRDFGGPARPRSRVLRRVAGLRSQGDAQGERQQSSA